MQRDRFNNFEEVQLDHALVGGYTLHVRSHNVPMGPQPFALVISGRLATPLNECADLKCCTDGSGRLIIGARAIK